MKIIYYSIVENELK